MVKKEIYILLLLLFPVFTSAYAQEVKMIAHTKVGTDPMGDVGGSFGSINGKSHQNDAVITHQGWQYAAYYNNQSPRKIVIARRKLTSSTWETLVYNRYNQTTNDGHNVICIGKAPHDGTLHLSFDHHGSALNYITSVKGLLTDPENKKWDNSQFGQVIDNLGFGVINSVTYPIFSTAPNGNLYFSRRHGNPKEGDQILYEYKDSKWVNVGKYIEGNLNNPYMDNLYIDRNGKMHAAWIWRNGSLATARDICYAYSDDYGRSWFDSKGIKVGTTNSGAMSKDGNPSLTAVPVPGNLMINQEGMTADYKGRPHIVHKKGSFIYHYYQDDYKIWHEINTNQAPKGRASIIADIDNNVYIVFSNLKIMKATEKEGYKDWKIVNNELFGKMTGEPLVDRYRMIENGILSVYMLSANYATCDVIDFSIGNLGGYENKPPKINFSEPSPTGNLIFEKGYQLTIVADASDEDGSVDNVELFIDDVLVRQESVAPYEWGHITSSNPDEVNGLTVGMHTLKIVATDNQGASQSANIQIQVVDNNIVSGINNNTTGEKTNVEIFPNPAKDHFTILTNNFQPTKIAIYDIDGKVVYHSNMQTNVLKINQSLNAGIYFVNLSSQNGEMIVKKMIIK